MAGRLTIVARLKCANRFISSSLISWGVCKALRSFVPSEFKCDLNTAGLLIKSKANRSAFPACLPPHGLWQILSYRVVFKLRTSGTSRFRSVSAFEAVKMFAELSKLHRCLLGFVITMRLFQEAFRRVLILDSNF